MIELSTVTTENGIDALRPEWQDVWESDASATPFQSPGWLLAWWRFFGTAEPRVLTARRHGRLVGLLPLYLLREAGCCKLLPFGVGLSDYIDGVADTEAPEAMRYLLGAAAGLPEWSEAWLPDLSPEGRLAQASTNAAAWTPAAAEPCPVLRLRGDLPDVVPRKTLRDLRQARSRAAAEGGARVELIDTAGVPGAMDDLFRLHERRWRERGEAGVCADPRIQDFHREAATALQRAGMLRLYRLAIADRGVAVYYGFAAKGGMYAYLGGFDPALPRLSPGAQIIGHAIEQACAEGLDRLDFLRGSEPYKYTWGAVDQPKLSLHLTRK